MTIMNAIDVRGLSKVYQLGEHLVSRQTFREKIVDGVLSYGQRLRRSQSAPKCMPNDVKEKWALTDISFSARPGEVLGLIGPNGAGKSTLLKVMSRITAPSVGKVVLTGRVGSLLEVGSGFHPELTGRENIFLYGAILGMSRPEILRQFDEIVEYAGIAQSVDTPVKRYSSGMYVRLAFSVAAFLRTDILFIDEVLAVGDLSFQRRCLGTVKNIADSGRTVVFVSHNMSIIQNLCHRVLLIDDGRLAYDGSTEAGIKHYIHSQQVEQARKGPLCSLTKDGDLFRFMGVSLRVTQTLGDSISDITSISTGESLSVQFSYIMRERCPGLEIVFSIYDELGVAVCNFSSRFKPPRNGPPRSIDAHAYSARFSDPARDDGVLNSGGDEPHTLTCVIDRLPLLPGRYRVNVLARQGIETLQHVTDAISFDVIGGDYFGTGVLPNIGAIAVDHQWYEGVKQVEQMQDKVFDSGAYAVSERNSEEQGFST